jgi:hypothetical protein
MSRPATPIMSVAEGNAESHWWLSLLASIYDLAA